jgi:hypothetical protein
MNSGVDLSSNWTMSQCSRASRVNHDEHADVDRPYILDQPSPASSVPTSSVIVDLSGDQRIKMISTDFKSQFSGQP